MSADWKHNSHNYIGWLSLLLGSFHEPANRGPCTMGVTHNRIRNKGATKFTWRQTLKQKIKNKKAEDHQNDHLSWCFIIISATAVGHWAYLRLFTHPVANLWSGPSLAVLMHSLLRHPLHSETKTEPDLWLPCCMLLRVVGSCCVRFETSKTNTSKFQFDLERTDTFKRVHMNS